MQPARTACPEDVLPIEVTGLAVRDRRIPPVRAADSGSRAEATLGEVQTVAYSSTDAVVWKPADERCVHSALQDQVFEQLSDWIPGKCRNDSGAHTKTPPQSAGNVVFSAALPGTKISRCVDTFDAAIKPQHYFSKADAGPLAAWGRFQGDRVHAQHFSWFECAFFKFQW